MIMNNRERSVKPCLTTPRWLLSSLGTSGFESTIHERWLFLSREQAQSFKTGPHRISLRCQQDATGAIGGSQFNRFFNARDGLVRLALKVR